MKPRVLLILSLVLPLSAVTSNARAATLFEVREIACAPSEKDIAVALGGQTIWLTRNSGLKWSEVARLPATRAIDRETEETDEDGDSPEVQQELIEHLEFPSSIDVTSEQNDPSLPDPILANGASNSPRALLAVSDGGDWAAGIGDQLFLGTSGKRGWRQQTILGLRGMVFDLNGGLWVTTSDSLEYLGKESATKGLRARWPFAGAGRPVNGPQPGALLVPGKTGIWLIPTHDITKGVLIPLPNGRAVAPIAGSAEKPWYAVSRGRLYLQTKRGVIRDLGSTFKQVERLFADRSGKVYIFSSAAGWSLWSPNALSSLKCKALAVDAAGRVWIARESGAIGIIESSPAGRSDSGGQPWQPRLGQEAFLSDSQFLGRPSNVHMFAKRSAGACKLPDFNPLPTARAVLRLGRRTRRHTESEHREEHSRIDTELFIGVLFTWQLRPATKAACYQQRRKWHDICERKTQKAASLRSEWHRAEIALQLAELPQEAVNASVDAMKLEALMRSLTDY